MRDLYSLCREFGTLSLVMSLTQHVIIQNTFHQLCRTHRPHVLKSASLLLFKTGGVALRLKKKNMLAWFNYNRFGKRGMSYVSFMKGARSKARNFARKTD